MDDYIVPEPKFEDYENAETFWAAYDEWLKGYDAWMQLKAEAEEAARIAAEEEAARIAAEEEAARIAAAEEAARAAAEEDAAQIVVEEVSADPEQGRVSDPSDRYSVGVYIAEFPLEAEPYDPGSVGSYVDAAGNLWSANGELMSPGTTPAMEPGVEELAAEVVAEPVTGEPVVDTALLLLDLVDALTGEGGLLDALLGEDGMTSDVDGLQETVEDVRQMLDHPFLTTSFEDYSVTEGLLLLLLLYFFIAGCARILKEGVSWLR